MANAFDLIDPRLFPNRAPAAGSGFGPNLRSGLISGGHTTLQQLHNVAGAVGSALGEDEFAAQRYADADARAARAAATAPRVTSLRDIGSGQDFADYAGGVIGGAAPTVAALLGATAATGGGVLPAIAAGTAVGAPLNIGDVIGRQRAAGREVDLGSAALSGGGAAVAESVLPGLAAARFGAGRLAHEARALGQAGKPAARTAEQGTGRILLRNAAAIPGEAAISAGGEVAKQFGAGETEIDRMAALDAAAGGAVVGAPFAALGTVGDLRARPPAPGMLDGARDALGRVTMPTLPGIPGVGAAGSALARGGEMVGGVARTLRDEGLRGAVARGSEALGDTDVLGRTGGALGRVRDYGIRALDRMVNGAPDAPPPAPDGTVDTSGMTTEALTAQARAGLRDAALAGGRALRDALPPAAQERAGALGALATDAWSASAPAREAAAASAARAGEAALAGAQKADAALLDAGQAARVRVARRAAEREGRNPDDAEREVRGGVLAAEAVTPPPTDPAPDADSVVDRIRGALESARGMGLDALERLAQGREMGDEAAIAAARGPELQQRLAESDRAREETTRSLLDRLTPADMSDEDKARFEKVKANISDRANQAWVATKALAVREKDRVLDATDKLRGSLDAKRPAAPEGTKESADFSGLRETIAREIAPELPNLDQDTAGRRKVADTLRVFIEQASRQDLDMDAITGVIRVLGDKSGPVMDRLFRAVAADEGPQAEQFFRNLTRVEQQAAGERDLTAVLAKHYTGGAVDPQTLRQAAGELIKWAQRRPGQSEKDRFRDEAVKNYVRTQFGAGADEVFDAIERQAGTSRGRVVMDGDEAEGRPLSADDTADRPDEFDTGVRAVDVDEMQDAPITYLGTSRAAKRRGGLVRDPAKALAETGNEGEAGDVLAKARSENPGAEVRFVPVDGEFGRVEVVREKLTGRVLEMSPADLDAVTLDSTKTSHKTGASRIDTGVHGRIINARALTKWAMGREGGNGPYRLAYNSTDDKGDAWRMARAFFEGLGAVQDRLGAKVDLDPAVVIGYIGNKPFTVAQASRLKFSPDPDRGDPERGNKAVDKIVDNRARRREAIVRELDNEPNAEQELRLRDELSKLDAASDTATAKDQMRGEREDNTVSRSEALLNDLGRYEVGDESDIVTAAAAGRVEPHRTNLDGTPVSHGARPDPIVALADTLKASTTPGRREQGRLLAEAHAGVRRLYYQGKEPTDIGGRLMEIAGEKSFSKRGEMIAALHKEFAGAQTPPTPVKALKPEQEAVPALATPEPAPTAPAAPEPAPSLEARIAARIDRRATKGDYTGFKDADAATKFVEAAVTRLATLRRMPSRSADEEAALAGLEAFFGRETKGRRALIGSLDKLDVTDRRSLEDTVDAMRYEAADDARALVKEQNAATEQFLNDLIAKPAAPVSEGAQTKLADVTRRAKAGDKELEANLLRTPKERAGALMTTLRHLVKTAPDTPAQIAAWSRMADLARDPDVAYRLTADIPDGAKPSRMKTDPLYQGQTPEEQQAVRDYVENVLGPAVRVKFEKILPAGTFKRVPDAKIADLLHDVIRVSVNALDPMGAAYHESLHGFFAKLSDMRLHGVSNVIMRTADSTPVRQQLRTLLRDEPDALRQVEESSEERAAYMYQFWKQGKLDIPTEPKSLLAKVAKSIRSTLGIWSNDERALHILRYFQSGEFAQSMANRNVVGKALLDVGRNATLDKIAAMSESMVHLGEAFAAAGGARVRDSDSAALRELADLLKRPLTEQGDDPGFIPASRREATRVLNSLVGALEGTRQEHLREALEQLQTGRQAQSMEARVVAKTVEKVLADMLKYMQEAGVRVGDLGLTGQKYFPRVYDASAISHDVEGFKRVLTGHGIQPDEADRITANLMSNDGADLPVEVSIPGMQHAKARSLGFIPDAALARFMRKDLLDIMSRYVWQAARRAEWSRRFGDDGSGVEKLLAEAEKEGATPQDLDAARKYVKSATGTLGDHIDPVWRRHFGSMLVYQNLRLLPMAIFSSVVDPAGIVVRGGSVPDAFRALRRGLSETVNNFRSVNPKDWATELAESLGVIENRTLIDAIGSSYGQGMIGDTGRKINDTFFRYNLMEQFNRSMRVGATEAALKFIAKHADGKASPHSVRWLAELGLEPGQVKLDKDGYPLIMEVQGISAAEEVLMRTAINRWVDGAVLRPDAADKPIWMNDPHYALFAHLKQFAYSFNETILKRVLHEHRAGNNVPMMALMSYVPIMIASDLLKGMIQGGGEQPDWKKDWGVGDYVWSGVQRAGLLGVGQPAVDAAGGFNDTIGAVAGPTIEQLADAVSAVGGKQQFDKFVVRSMPANALYGEALTD